TFKAYGHGLIQAIIDERMEQARLMDTAVPIEPNGRVSFIHSGDATMASYRYRAAIPARELGASINDRTASTLIFAKPLAHQLIWMGIAKKRQQRVIVDICDDHLDWLHYQEALRLADQIVCPTDTMARLIRARGYEATIIPDPYEFPRREPHCGG